MTLPPLHAPHWMLQEIWEQPDVVRTCLKHWAIADHFTLDSLQLSELDIQTIQQIRIVGCGTSLHAGWLGKLWLEAWIKIPTTLYPASELRHTLPPALANTLTIAITQSGETADVLNGCLQLQAQDAQEQVLNSRYIGITNQAGSSLETLTMATLVTPAGQEVSIAATKTFTATLITLYGLVLAIAQNRQTLTPTQSQQISQSLTQLPNQITEVLSQVTEPIQAIAQAWKDFRHCIILGRGLQAAIAAEAALKLKETAHIHAEGFAAGEFLHGPIALLDNTIPVIAITTTGLSAEGMISILPQLKARGAPILAISSTATTPAVQPWVDSVLVLPDLAEDIAPVLTILPLQLLAYYGSLQRNLDPDHPRGLVKAISKNG